jgi:hypothetical protein
VSSFVELYKPEPVELFVVTMRRNRPALKALFDDAMVAGRSFADTSHRSFRTGGEEGRRLHTLSYTQNVIVDLISTPLLLVADDALQRLGGALLGRHSFDLAYGPRYHHEKSAPLTQLLRAMTNCVRHVSEWNDSKTLTFPYFNEFEPAKTARNWKTNKQAMQTIEILHANFGLGANGPITAAPTFMLLKLIEGRFGTPGVVPDYFRFETAIMQAAREMADDSGHAVREEMEQLFADDSGVDQVL